LTLLYTGVFSVSVLVLLGFIYWSTVAVIERQTAETIESEIRGLAEQYRQQGVNRLVQVIGERSGEKGDRNNVYILTDANLNRLAGNVRNWPTGADAEGQWVRLGLQRQEEDRLVPHEIRARTFTLPGGHQLLVGRDMNEKTKFRNTVVETLAWSLAATVVLGVIGGLFVSRRMLRRVDQVSHTAQGIMQGDLSRRMRKSGSDDEFDRLAESLNAMLDQIERLMTGMRWATESIAHDLRSPLTRLRTRIELALRDPPSPGQDREALADALAQTDAALALFDSLLKIATAEAGVAPTEPTLLDLADLARDAAELYEPVAEDKGIALGIHAPGPARVRGQAQLLAQAVANLLDNAVKNTPPDGRISVSIESDEHFVTLTVADTGPGIPEADRERVLERFVRLEPSRQGPGTGLGLSLVAAVAKLHGATLRLKDNEPGLKVALRLPTFHETS
jgi:signal transduction histidine kinase